MEVKRNGRRGGGRWKGRRGGGGEKGEREEEGSVLHRHRELGQATNMDISPKGTHNSFFLQFEQRTSYFSRIVFIWWRVLRYLGFPGGSDGK